MVEFAFIAFLLYLLLAGTLDLGRLMFSAQAVQDAARVGAREISVIPLPADMTFTQAMADPKVRARVFQPEHLVIDLENIPGGLSLEDFFGTLPVLNQMLRPLMIFEKHGGQRILRYPGALLTDATTPSGFTVGIPYIVGRDADGVETIRWVPVIEEISNPNFPGASPFQLNTPAGMPQRGLVALRINYPFQAAMMGAYRDTPPSVPNIGNPILADDAAVTQLNAAPGGFLADDNVKGPYSGPLGLGRFHSASQRIRPFRRLISAQQEFRREVFE